MQDAYLENNVFNNGLTRAFTYISIRSNLSALKEVPEEVIKLLFIVDPNIVNFKRQVKELYTEIK